MCWHVALPCAQVASLRKASRDQLARAGAEAAGGASALHASGSWGGAGRDALMDLVGMAVAPDRVTLPLKALDTLSEAEKKEVAQARKMDELPSGWFFDGYAYVEADGGRSALHPSLGTFLQVSRGPLPLMSCCCCGGRRHRRRRRRRRRRYCCPPAAHCPSTAARAIRWKVGSDFLDKRRVGWL
jgi:hypothetical protein